MRYILLFYDVLSGQCRLSEIFPSQFPLFIFSFSTSLSFFVIVLSHVPYVRSSHLFEVFPFILPFSFLFILCHSFESYSPCIMPSIPLTHVLPPPTCNILNLKYFIAFYLVQKHDNPAVDCHLVGLFFLFLLE